MKKIYLLLLMLISPLGTAEGHPLIGLWEGVNQSSLVFYTRLKVDENLSGSFILQSDSTYGGSDKYDLIEFSGKDVREKGGYYEIQVKKENAIVKLVISVGLHNRLQIWQIVPLENGSHQALHWQLNKVAGKSLKEVLDTIPKIANK